MSNSAANEAGLVHGAKVYNREDLALRKALRRSGTYTEGFAGPQVSPVLAADPTEGTVSPGVLPAPRRRPNRGQTVSPRVLPVSSPASSSASFRIDLIRLGHSTNSIKWAPFAESSSASQAEATQRPSRATSTRRPRPSCAACGSDFWGLATFMPVCPPGLGQHRTAPSLEDRAVLQDVRKAKKDASQRGGVSGSSRPEEPAEKEDSRPPPPTLAG